MKSCVCSVYQEKRNSKLVKWKEMRRGFDDGQQVRQTLLKVRAGKLCKRIGRLTQACKHSLGVPAGPESN